MILRQTIGKGAKVGYGLGNDLQGRHMVISSMPKRNCHGIRYQSYNRGRNGRVQKENKMTRPYLAFPPLSWTFRSGDISTLLHLGRKKMWLCLFVCLPSMSSRKMKRKLEMLAQLCIRAHRTSS